MTTILLINQVPTKAVENQTPYEALSGIKPSATFLRVFDCISNMDAPSRKISKLEEKVENGIFVG